MSMTISVTDQYSVRIWLDKSAEVNRYNWCWQVIELAPAPKVVRSGKTSDEEKAHWAARMAIWIMI